MTKKLTKNPKGQYDRTVNPTVWSIRLYGKSDCTVNPTVRSIRYQPIYFMYQAVINVYSYLNEILKI